MRYFREGERSRVARDLCEKRKAPTVYRAEMASKIMRFGDPEPPHLYSADVLETAKKTIFGIASIASRSTEGHCSNADWNFAFRNSQFW